MGGMSEDGYWRATRHPWPCLWFLLPLLAAYEGGVLWLGGTHPEALRNGADTWLHQGLEAFGFNQLYWTPALIAVIFLAWSWQRRQDRPAEVSNVCVGMAMESLAFAAGLWGLSRGLDPFLKSLGIQLAVSRPKEQILAQLITFVGAGIYEEVLFRLLLFTALVWLLRQCQAGPVSAFLGAALGGALLFAAVHHTGRTGEAFDAYNFLFRTLAGLYFTLIFRFRGFGIAVGTHAGYDMLACVFMK
jgi:membrane protease YdiL (CAAX protease family)